MKLAVASHQLILRALLCDHLNSRYPESSVSTASSCSELEAYGANLSDVDLLIVDSSLPGGDVLMLLEGDAMRRLAGKTLLLTTLPAGYLALRAMRLGIGAIVRQQDPIEVLHAAAQAVLGGAMFVSPSMKAAERAIFAGVLSAREVSVLTRLARGRSLSEVGAERGVTASTAETHKRNSSKKLRIRGQRELLVFALRHGLVTLDEILAA